MRTRIIAGAAIIITAVLVLLSSAEVFGCIASEQNPSCGDGPLNPRQPLAEWELIQPNQSIWYALTYVGPRLDVWVDANGQKGLALEVYRPGTQGSGEPVGHGAFNKAVGKDLYWTGRAGGGGTWYALMTNRGPDAVLFRLSYNPENPAAFVRPVDAPKTIKPNAVTLSTNPKLAKPVVAPNPPAAPAPPVAGSLDPNQAPAPNADWVWIQPFTAMWYKANDGGRRLSVYINSNGARGLSLEVFAPDQKNPWDARPVGQGTDGKGFDLFWTGRSRQHGDWLVRVTNHNDFAVNYSLGTTLIADRAGDLCGACHGIIEDEWDRCEHSGSFCEDLKEEYRN